MKRVLLISYYFPPSGGPGVQRILKFVRYLPQNGWLPTVLTVNPNYAAFPSIDDSLLEEIPSDVEVVRTRAWDPFSVYGRIQGKRRDEVIKVGYIDGSQGLKNVAQWLRVNDFLPDA
ncbi:MAG: glycosyltransferase family 4 protein, partial [Rhodothermaceae bacterium]|nr:glycosyltransferase family 4 protein [Rhodothermaceae bacterium]